MAVIPLPAKDVDILAEDTSGGANPRGPFYAISKDAISAVALVGIADVTSNGTPQQLPPLVAGPNGILLMAHPSNGAVVIRIDGDNTVGAAKGTPLPFKASVLRGVANANLIWHCTENGSNAVLCVAQA